MGNTVPDTADNHGNQRVTNALLRSDIRHLTDLTEREFGYLRARDADHENRIRANETAITTQRERLANTTRVFAGIQVAFAAVVSWIKLSS